MEEVKAKGLKWMNRPNGRQPYWIPSYVPPGEKRYTVPLAHLMDSPGQLLAKCALLQAQMNALKAGISSKEGEFDGTLGSLLEKYRSEPDSSYFGLRPHSRKPYAHYLPKLITGHGDRRLDKITGVDLKRWHDAWSDGGKHLAASKLMRAVVDAAVSYGIMCRIDACIELREVLKAASRKIPNPKRREIVITADEVIALRASAHAAGRPSSALAYALVYESTLRLWDVIGQWVPVDSLGISDVVNTRTNKKWFGLRWDDIDANLVLRYVPSKTSMKTGLAVAYPLARAQMVMEELEHWPAEKRTGPVVVYEMNGRPYLSEVFSSMWSNDRKAAELPANIWARDLRASGISEARAAGVATDDAAKVAGHASTKTTSAVYDRSALEAAERFADSRTIGRKTKS